MSPWDGASRWINTLLLVVVGFIGFDTLFRLLEANERNVIVGFARSVSTVLLTPFEGMFDEQEYLLTALIAVLGYALVAGIAMAVIRSVQASRRRRRGTEGAAPEGNSSGAWQSRRPEPPANGSDTAQLSGPPPAHSGRDRDATAQQPSQSPDKRGAEGQGTDPSQRADPGSQGSGARGGTSSGAGGTDGQPAAADRHARTRSDSFAGGSVGDLDGPSNGRAGRARS